MATIKSYTDLDQSKKLAEILPIESADMSYCAIHNIGQETYHCNVPIFTHATHGDIPAWSLAALLDVLNKSAYFINEAGIAELSSVWRVSILNCGKIKDCYADNPVDACYEMVIRLNELKML